jgi:hypothetical protein
MEAFDASTAQHVTAYGAAKWCKCGALDVCANKQQLNTSPIGMRVLDAYNMTHTGRKLEHTAAAAYALAHTLYKMKVRRARILDLTLGI